MTTTLRARFDGKVLIPEEPVKLPTDRLLEVRATDAPAPAPSTENPEPPLMRLAKALEGLPANPDSPTDGSVQHDHYLYGTPKRENP